MSAEKMYASARRQFLIILILILFCLYLLIMGVSRYIIYRDYEHTFILLFLSLTGFLYAFQSLKNIKKSLERIIPPEQTITVVKCRKCSYKEERSFQLGDFIFKEIGVCSKCSGPLYIEIVYSVPIKPPKFLP